MISHTSSTPLYTQIQDRLFEQIRGGELSPGERVPSELELAEQFNVSRMTARKALDGLVSRGLLFRHQGKGTFVAQNVVSYNLSTMLSFSATMRALGHEVMTQVLIQDVIPAPEPVAEKLMLQPGASVALIRRLRLLDGHPAAVHTSFLDYALFAPILQVDLSTNSLLTSIERILPAPVSYSKDSVQARLVEPGDRSLLQITADSPVLNVEGVAYTANGQPIRFTRAVYRSDMFRLIVTNTGAQNATLHVTGSSSG
jgi:GntR family transcriptional regulator